MVDLQFSCELFFVDMFMLDVWVLVEFGKGVFLIVVNLLLMNDSECYQVGLCYKEQGQ